jgi:ubiquinone/menaquinone biosynthesis C-methylase UbiE
VNVKTDYQAHDRHYARRRRDGLAGWSEERDYSEWQTECERILQRGNAPARGRLLDLGCGAGNMTLWFARLGYDAHGIDIAPTAIDWARERARTEHVAAEFTVGDAVNLSPYEDSSFDFVFDGRCLHCVIGGDRATLLRNVRRVLRPGGYFLIQTMCGPVVAEHLSTEQAQHYDPDSGCFVYDGVAYRYIGEPREILAEVERASLTILGHEIAPIPKGQPNADLTVEATRATG